MSAQAPPERPHLAPAPAPSDPAPLSIRVVSRRTAIEADTLRVWERRYGFPKPERRPGGSRVYRESDIEALLLIRRALVAGYRPGEVVHRPVEELARLVDPTSARAVRGIAPTVEATLDALARDDLGALREEMKRAAAVLGPRGFVTKYAHPASVRVGERWAAGKLEVRHEHVFTACLSGQLHVLLSAFEDASGPSVLLASLPGEPHSLGLDMIAVVLADAGVTPRRLGVHTPAQQIVAAARAYGCNAVGLAVMPPVDVPAVMTQIHGMLADLPRGVPVWAGGSGAAALDPGVPRLVLVPDWAALDAAIDALFR